MLLKYLYSKAIWRNEPWLFSEVLCHRCGAGFAVPPGLIISWGSGGLRAGRNGGNGRKLAEVSAFSPFQESPVPEPLLNY